MVTVNAISEYSGLSVHTVRYYPRIGLLKLWRHPENKHRVFKASNVDRARFIRRAQSLGFTLSEKFDILTSAEKRRSSCRTVRHILQLRIHESKTKIIHLMELQARMEKTFALWQTLSNNNPDAHNICRLIDSADEAPCPLDCKPIEGTHNV